MKKGAQGDIKAGMEAEETRHAATNKHKGRLRLRAMRLDGVLHAACCMLHAAYCVFGYMPHQHQRQYNTNYKPSTATMNMKQQQQALRCAVLWRKQSPSLPIPK